MFGIIWILLLYACAVQIHVPKTDGQMRTKRTSYGNDIITQRRKMVTQ